MTVMLRKTQFKSWLEKQDLYKTVGYAGSSALCPIANYITQNRGGIVHIYGETWAVEGNNKMRERELPKWAKEFITRVDNINLKNSERIIITAWQAIEILKECNVN